MLAPPPFLLSLRKPRGISADQRGKREARIGSRCGVSVEVQLGSRWWLRVKSTGNRPVLFFFVYVVTILQVKKREREFLCLVRSKVSAPLTVCLLKHLIPDFFPLFLLQWAPLFWGGFSPDVGAWLRGFVLDPEVHLCSVCSYGRMSIYFCAHWLNIQYYSLLEFKTYPLGGDDVLINV